MICQGLFGGLLFYLKIYDAPKILSKDLFSCCNMLYRHRDGNNDNDTDDDNDYDDEYDNLLQS